MYEYMFVETFLGGFFSSATIKKQFKNMQNKDGD